MSYSSTIQRRQKCSALISYSRSKLKQPNKLAGSNEAIIWIVSFCETIANDNEAADQISRLFTDVRNFLSFHCPDVPRIHQTHADTEPAHVVMAMMMMMAVMMMVENDENDGDDDLYDADDCNYDGDDWDLEYLTREAMESKAKWPQIERIFESAYWLITLQKASVQFWWKLQPSGAGGKRVYN